MSCFAEGTLIETEDGFVPVETIQPGDLVETRGAGPEPVKQVARRDLWAGHLIENPQHRPVLVPAGSLGDGAPWRDLILSPRHRIRIGRRRAERLLGSSESLVAAARLCGMNGIRQLKPSRVSYVHLVFARGCAVRAEGIWTEGGEPGVTAEAGEAADANQEILELFPQLADGSVTRVSAGQARAETRRVPRFAKDAAEQVGL